MNARKDYIILGRRLVRSIMGIKGGGTFADKADNVVIVWRHNRGITWSDPEVTFESQKIKKQKLVGVPNLIDNLIFNIKTNRYYINEFTPFFEIDDLLINSLGIKPKEKHQELPEKTISVLDLVAMNRQSNEPMNEDEIPF